MNVGDTIRSKCGRARLTYKPDWSPSQPWASYIDGTAGRCFPTAAHGIQQLGRKGFTFDTAPEGEK